MTAHPDVVIAIESGHSDAISGIAAKPLVAMSPLALSPTGGRAATPEVADQNRGALERRHAIATAAGDDVQAGPPRRNHAGGITTLEEKSLGAIAEGGDQQIAGLLDAGDALLFAAGLT